MRPSSNAQHIMQLRLTEFEHRSRATGRRILNFTFCGTRRGRLRSLRGSCASGPSALQICACRTSRRPTGAPTCRAAIPRAAIRCAAECDGGIARGTAAISAALPPAGPAGPVMVVASRANLIEGRVCLRQAAGQSGAKFSSLFLCRRNSRLVFGLEAQINGPFQESRKIGGRFYGWPTGGCESVLTGRISLEGRRSRKG